MISLRVTDTYLLKYIDVCELSCKNVRWQTLIAGNVFFVDVGWAEGSRNSHLGWSVV